MVAFAAAVNEKFVFYESLHKEVVLSSCVVAASLIGCTNDGFSSPFKKSGRTFAVQFSVMSPASSWL